MHPAAFEGLKVASDGAPTADDPLLSSRMVRACFNVTDMTIWRWQQDPKVGFPPPIKIGDRSYWKSSTIEAWWTERVASGLTAEAAKLAQRPLPGRNAAPAKATPAVAPQPEAKGARTGVKAGEL